MPKKKTLVIELKKEVQEILQDYIKAADIDPEDLGFSMGFLNAKLGADKEAMGQLLFMFQLYFFAGVRYAKETKGFGYGMFTTEERNEFNKKVTEDMEKMIRHSGDKPPSYMG